MKYQIYYGIYHTYLWVFKYYLFSCSFNSYFTHIIICYIIRNRERNIPVSYFCELFVRQEHGETLTTHPVPLTLKILTLISLGSSSFPGCRTWLRTRRSCWATWSGREATVSQTTSYTSRHGGQTNENKGL